MKYLPRTIEPHIKTSSKIFKAVMVSGMRQVGKSTLLKHLAGQDRSVVTLRGLRAHEVDTNPALFFKQNPPPAVVTGVQLAPALFGELGAAVRESRKAGQYWFSCTEKLHLMERAPSDCREILTSLDLFPMSIYELEGKGLKQKPFVPSKEVSFSHTLKNRSVEETWEAIFKGGWPSIHFGSVKPQEFFDLLVLQYMRGDVGQILNIDKAEAFRKFLYGLALCSGQELNIRALVGIAGISYPTVHKWLSIAKATGLIWLLPSIAGDMFLSLTGMKRQLRKSPRMYLVDTGLLAYLLKIKTPEEMASHVRASKFFETFVVMEIVKSWLHNYQWLQLYYLQDDKGAEIDLIMKVYGEYRCIEIKNSTHPDIRATKWIKKFNVRSFSGPSSVICMTDHAYPLSESIVAHSIWDI